jgi:hypothetical protein
MKLSVFALTLGVAAALFGNSPLGKPLKLQRQTPIDQLLQSPDRYVAKTVQVKGRVTEVCEMMGCWMRLVADSGKSIRVKVQDGEIVFPKQAIGKLALAEGTLAKLELTREQAVARARHEAEERGQKFDPELVKGPVTIYEIRGTGALIVE